MKRQCKNVSAMIIGMTYLILIVSGANLPEVKMKAKLHEYILWGKETPGKFPAMPPIRASYVVCLFSVADLVIAYAADEGAYIGVWENGEFLSDRYRNYVVQHDVREK